LSQSEWPSARKQITTSAGEDGVREELLVGYKLEQSLWKLLWKILKKLKIDLLYYPAISLLAIYPKKCKSAHNRDTCMPIFIVALSTIAKLWNQPRWPSMD
jgi:hypothetical protein